MRIGISSWTYPWAVGVPGYPASPSGITCHQLLAKAIALGVGVLQIGDNLPLEALLPHEIASLRVQAAAAGIALEASTRGVEPAHLRRLLRIAQLLDARLLRSLTHTNDSRPGLVQIESWLREVLPDFESAGVSIGLENYERHTAKELASLVERIGSPSLGVCLDTVNSLGILETPSQVVEVLAPWVINIHVKDFSIDRIDTMLGYAVRGCPAGEGRLDLPSLLESIDRYGRRPNLILEQWPPFTNSVQNTIELEDDWANRGVRFLKSFG
jgi:sugar phosphate isomerase/epimerase